jgi:ankyrin repeat protein
MAGTILHRYVSFYEQVKLDVRTVMILLIQAGVDLNAKENKIGKQRTALHIAAEKGSSLICELLLDNGTIIDAQDKYGNTPLWLATMDYSVRQAGNREAKGEVIELLLARGANPTLANYSGFSALDLAKTLGGTDVKKYFETVN